MTDALHWHTAAAEYLARLDRAEYDAARERHRKAGRRPSTYRHTPSEYMTSLIRCMDRDDEEGFKALKGLQGYASEIRV